MSAVKITCDQCFKLYASGQIELDHRWERITLEEGTHHHVIVVLTRRLNIRRANYFDIMHQGQSYHPNIKSVRSQGGLQRVITYTCKDGNVASKGINWEQALSNAQKKSSIQTAVVAQKIVDNPEVTLEELISLAPNFMMHNLQKAKAFKRELMRIAALKRELVPFNGCIPSEVSWSANTPDSLESAIQIAKWINSNFTTSPRAHKTKQLWIHGSTGLGKSRLIWKMMKRFRGYELPNDKGWFDDFENDYDFLYADEYRGHLTVRMLNSLAEGRLMTLPRRGTAPIQKSKNMPLIVCSNLSPYETYSKCTPVSLEALLARFIVVYLPGPFNLHFCSEDGSSSNDDTCELMSDNDE